MSKPTSKQSGLEWLDRSLLTSPYCYALCLSEKAFNAEMKRLKVSEPGRWLKNTHCGATIHYFEKGASAGLCAIVCLNPAHDVAREQVYALLVHESVHLWRAIKDHLGEDAPASEEEAYAIQRIAQSLMFSYKEQTTKKKRKK